MRLTIRIEEGELSLLCIRFDFMNRSIHFYYLMYTEACGPFSWENGNFEENIYVDMINLNVRNVRVIRKIYSNYY